MKKFDVVEWMAEHGHTSYQERIRDLQERIDLTWAEAGRYGQFCEYTQADIKKMKDEIAEIRREADDRYTDWASD